MAISDNQRDDNADTRQKNQPDSVISNGVWYYPERTGSHGDEPDDAGNHWLGPFGGVALLGL